MSSSVLRPPQRYANSLKNRYVAVVGDSIISGTTTGVGYYDQIPSFLGQLLYKRGCCAVCRNFGISGQRTDEMLARINQIFRRDFGTPDLVVLEGGSNDYNFNSGTAQANITLYMTAMVKYLKAGAKGYVTNPSSLPANGNLGDYYVVTVDNDSTGGFNPDSGQSGAGGNACTLWKCTGVQGGIKGWGRANTPSTWVVPKIVIMNKHFLNFSGSGDNYSPTAVNSESVIINTAVHNVCVNEDVLEGDIWTWLANRIASGEFTYQDWTSWHCADGDIHPSAQGCNLFAQYLDELIADQTDWVTDLSKPKTANTIRLPLAY